MTNFFYYSIPKTPQDMTPEELIQEIQAANQAHAQAEINQASISTKETVRRQNCETELVSRPKGIDRWNEEFGNYYPCCHCDGTGIIENQEHGNCNCTACNGTGEATEDD